MDWRIGQESSTASGQITMFTRCDRRGDRSAQSIAGIGCATDRIV